MVPNNLSLGWGHSRSSSQCILKCHDWYKGQKQSDAFETLPGESRCTCDNDGERLTFVMVLIALR